MKPNLFIRGKDIILEFGCRYFNRQDGKDEPKHPKNDMESNSDDKKVTLATLVKGNPKAPFSIATTPRCRVERHFFLCIARILSLIPTL